jgi:hypothetical protein
MSAVILLLWVGIDGRRMKILRKQTHQVIENTGEMSGIGQNNPNLGHSTKVAEKPCSERLP